MVAEWSEGAPCGKGVTVYRLAEQSEDSGRPRIPDEREEDDDHERSPSETE